VPPLCTGDRSCRCTQPFVCRFPFMNCMEKSWNELVCDCPFC
jgi:hypothetical protein